MDIFSVTNRLNLLLKEKLKYRVFAICSLLILLSSLRPDSLYDFRSVYLRDLNELYIEHGVSVSDRVKIFRQFLAPPLSKFNYSNRTAQGTTIKSWIRRNGDLRQIRIIQSTISIDTTVEFTDIETGMVTDRIPVKGDFHFKVYVFDKQSSPQRLIYITSPNSGLQYFLIDGKSDGPLRESIETGIDEALEKLRKEVAKASGIHI